jgi:hypothetical protein
MPVEGRGLSSRQTQQAARDPEIGQPLRRKVLNLLLAATHQALAQEALQVFSAHMTGTVDKRLHLLYRPIPCSDAGCRVEEMTEGFLHERDFGIIATAVEQPHKGDDPDLGREIRLFGSEVPRGAHEGRRLGSEVSCTYEGDL